MSYTGISFAKNPPARTIGTDVSVHIVDGDTFTIKEKGKVERYRLIGIDAPEKGQEFSEKSTQFLKKLLSSGEIQLEFDKKTKDRYHRFLVYVWVNDTLVNEEIVAEGLAVAKAYRPNLKHQSRLKNAQNYAKKNKTGFWLQGGLKVYPREFKKNNPKRK